MNKTFVPARLSLNPEENPDKYFFDARSEVSIGRGRETPRDDFHHGHHLAAERDVGKANLFSNLANQLLMFRVKIRVHEYTGQGGDATFSQPLQISAKTLLVKLVYHMHPLSSAAFQVHPSVLLQLTSLTLKQEPFIHLKNLLIEHLWTFDIQFEQLRACLVANEEDI